MTATISSGRCRFCSVTVATPFRAGHSSVSVLRAPDNPAGRSGERWNGVGGAGGRWSIRERPQDALCGPSGLALGPTLVCSPASFLRALVRSAPADDDGADSLVRLATRQGVRRGKRKGQWVVKVGCGKAGRVREEVAVKEALAGGEQKGV